MTWQEKTLYPKVALKRLLSKSEEWITPQAEEEYQLLTIRMWGKGIVERGIMKGSEIAAKRMYVVRPQQFIISRIDARHGASGVIPDKFDGAITTNEFPIFNTNTSVLVPQYLGWLSKTPDFIELCKVASEGTTNRVRLKEDKFLNLEIPLPPLEEQRRIVARIEELSTAIAEARGLRQKSLVDCQRIRDTIARQLLDKHLDHQATIEKLIGRVNLKNGISIKSINGVSEIACLRCSAMRDGFIDLNDAKPVPMDRVQAEPYLIQHNDVFIIRGNGSKELVGKAGWVSQASDGKIFPDLFIRVPLDKEKILPQFFVLWWNSPTMRVKIQEMAKTTSGIWKINQGHIASLTIPVLSLDEQRRIVAYLDDLQAKIDSLKRLQAETAAELDALLPSILDKAFKGEL